jgi:hypothetical protein
MTEQPGRWPVPAPFGGPRGQHGSSTTSGNYGNQPGTTGIAPRRPVPRATRTTKAPPSRGWR